MRHADRCVFWTPTDKAEMANSLTEAALTLPPGKMLVYRCEPPFHGRKRLMAVATRVANRLGLALVQWPNAGPEIEGRRWCWAMQRRGAA